MRKIISIRIDPQVWKADREKGLNISRICEEDLKQAVQDEAFLRALWWAGPDLNRRPSPREGDVLAD